MQRHELAVSKLVAEREKDLDFLIEMVRNHLLDEDTILQRIPMLPATGTTTADLRERWNRIVNKARKTP